VYVVVEVVEKLVVEEVGEVVANAPSDCILKFVVELAFSGCVVKLGLKLRSLLICSNISS
jgi:hypothetical protein